MTTLARLLACVGLTTFSFLGLMQQSAQLRHDLLATVSAGASAPSPSRADAARAEAPAACVCPPSS